MFSFAGRHYTALIVCMNNSPQRGLGQAAGDAHAMAAPMFTPKVVSACPPVRSKHDKLATAFNQPSLCGWSNNDLLKLKMLLTETYK